MKFNFALASEDEWRQPIEINTLEDLLALVEKYNEAIIIEKNGFGINDWSIQVYDSYIE